jgi:UDP-N-acetylglucosamine 2-epimerase (non-hydrolysing)/UDP-GlcNAc3NAcA epimerase
MRSFDRSMPEELNRVMADHASALLLCPSETAAANLEREGVNGRVELIGDVMVDVALKVQPRMRDRLDLIARHGLEPHQYVLATAHRAGNVDDPARFGRLVELLSAVPHPLLLPLHPRTRARLDASGLLDRLEQTATLTPPLGYLELTALMCNARAVLTDSGGLQKEAYVAGVPCLTLRSTTEWAETVKSGWNTLIDLDSDRMLRALERKPPAERPPLYGDGRAGERVVEALTLIAHD